MTIVSAGTPALYVAFTLLVIALLAVDFIVLKAQGAHRVSVKEAAAWSGGKRCQKKVSGTILRWQRSSPNCP